MLEILLIKIQSLKNVTFCGHIASICSRRCPARILAVDPSATTSSRPMSGTGLRWAGTGRCCLEGRAAWWGTRPRVPSSTLISFGGVRVGQFQCGGTRPRRRWYVAVSGRRISTSILHGCIRGRQVLQYLAVSLGISLQLWSCEGSFSLGVHRPRRRNRECPRFFCSIRSLLANSQWCTIQYYILFETMYSRLYLLF